MSTPAPVHRQRGARPSTRRALWPALAALALAVGFGDLARGGTTLAPGLLVLGYVVLVPAAVVGATGRRPPPAPPNAAHVLPVRRPRGDGG